MYNTDSELQFDDQEKVVKDKYEQLMGEWVSE